MTNIAITNLVEQAVLDQMRAKASFTALDISNHLKFECYPVQHRVVAEAVREIYESGAMTYYDYGRETIPVVTAGGTKRVRAFLYHFQETKPCTYQTRDQDALPPVPADQARDLTDSVPAGPACVLPRALRSVSSTAPRSAQRRTRRDGALAVPKQAIAQLGWPDGTRLSLRQDGGHIVIGSVSGGASALTVWGGQRLRICRTVLSKAMLSADTVTIAVEGNELQVGSNLSLPAP